jgi:hypothetical protein
VKGWGTAGPGQLYEAVRHKAGEPHGNAAKLSGVKMVPARFAVEYPERCLALLELLEPLARERKLLGSFSLLVASSALLIPYERMKERHPLHRKGRDSDLSRALRSLEKKEKFLTADFWNGQAPDAWRFSRITSNPNNTLSWQDEHGCHPMGADAVNSIDAQEPEKSCAQFATLSPMGT